jgi:hypothetical protein
VTLLELHVDVARVANALERIVFLLEKLVLAPPPADVRVQQATLDDLHIITPDDTERIKSDQMRFAEIHRVVPGSEAFATELMAWEREQRSLHGEDWKAPDWAEILVSAQGGNREV